MEESQLEQILWVRLPYEERRKSRHYTQKAAGFLKAKRRPSPGLTTLAP